VIILTILVKEIMKEPLYLNENESINKAIEVFKVHKISGAPVINNENQFVGIISEEDIIKTLITHDDTIHIDLPSPLDLIELPFKTFKKLEEYREDIDKALSSKIKDIMNTDVITISGDATINEASKLMVKHKIKRLPVVDCGALIGIITRHDIIEALCNNCDKL